MARKLGKTAEEKAQKKSDKQRVKETVAEVEGAKVATTDTKKDFFAQARDAKAELDEKTAEARVAAQARNKAHAQYRNVLKEAGRAGIDSEAMADALTIVEQDPVQVARHNRNVNEFLVIAEYPLEPSGQLGMFADGTTVSARVDQAKLGDPEDVATAKEKGVIAGKAGVNKNPYAEASPEFVAYEVAYQDEQDKLLATIGRGNGGAAQAAAH